MFRIVRIKDNKVVFSLFASYEEIVLFDYKPVNMPECKLDLNDEKIGNKHRYTASFGIYKLIFDTEDGSLSLKVYQGKRMVKEIRKMNMTNYYFLIQNKDGADSFENLNSYITMLFTFLSRYYGNERLAYISKKDIKFLFPKE